MAFIAEANRENVIHDYILGDTHNTEEELFPDLFGDGQYKDSILVNRYYYLEDLENRFNGKLKIALQDKSTGAWTKWKEFPAHVLEHHKNKWGHITCSITTAIDVHRSMFSNEIVVESDYPTYEANYDAIRIIGAIIERKGFIPHYYYSGNKSIHLHIFLDWSCMKAVDLLLQDRLRIHFAGSQKRFRSKFIAWLRERMVTCWDTLARKFDKDLISAKHLIRSELSRNKLGFKTFLGHSFKDMSFIPTIRNEINGLYPRLGAIRLSSPPKIGDILEEFYQELLMTKKKRLILRKNDSLQKWIPGGKVGIRGCVKAIMSPEFIRLGDGYHRGMFILVNELRKVLGDSAAKVTVLDWNQKLQKPLRKEDIEYRFRSKTYILTCKYIHSFLEDLNINISKKCNGKIYIS